jgi:hypothetical protein
VRCRTVCLAAGRGRWSTELHGRQATVGLARSTLCQGDVQCESGVMVREGGGFEREPRAGSCMQSRNRAVRCTAAAAAGGLTSPPSDPRDYHSASASGGLSGSTTAPQRERSLAKPEQTHADCHQAVAGAWRPWPTRRSAVRLYEVQRALGLAGDVTGASLPASNQVELALGPEAVFRHTSPLAPLAAAR